MRSRSYKTLLIFFLSLVLHSANAQQSKAKYTGSIEGVAMKGGQEIEVAMNTAHGIRIKNWSGTVGAGVDYYRYKSVPLYVDVKRFISAGKKQFFAQGSIGMNIATPTSSEKYTQRWWSSWWPNNDTLSFTNGLYSKAAVGMVFNPRNKIKVNFSIGWSYKSMSTTNYELIYNGSSAEYAPRKTIYGMNRLAVTLGIGI